MSIPAPEGYKYIDGFCTKEWNPYFDKNLFIFENHIKKYKSK